MAQDLGQLTDMWMVNPTMFDPTQKSNKFSLFNNAALPFPPSYSGAPTNAMGQPIQSFVDWQKANPGGVSINSTPAQPAAPQAGGISPYSIAKGNPAIDAGNMSAGLMAMNSLLPQGNGTYSAGPGTPPGFWGSQSPLAGNAVNGVAAQQAQASAPPNNWQAALNALANPGNPVTQGATVPLQSGTQPAGGVNNAFLQQAGAGQGMNQNFLSALRAIQGR